MKSFLKRSFIISFAFLAMVLTYSFSTGNAYAMPQMQTFSVSPSSCTFPCTVTVTWQASGATNYYIVHSDQTTHWSEFSGSPGSVGSQNLTGVSVSLPNGDNTFVFFGDSTQLASVTVTNPTPTPTAAPTPTPTPNPLQISNLSVSATINSAVVTWNTTNFTNSFVDYGVATINDNTLTQNHRVTLNNLTGGTTYQYRVRSTDASGNSVQSNQLSFMTNPNSSGSSSNPTPTPTPSSSGSTSSTTTNTTSSTIVSSGSTSTNSSVSTTETPAPTNSVLGASTSAVTPTPTIAQTQKQSSNKSSKPLPFYLIAATGIMIVVTGLLLQMAGVIKIGVFEKILRFLLGL